MHCEYVRDAADHISIETLIALVSRRCCECGREVAALEKEFGPGLIGHLVVCAVCGGTAHHTGDHTVCLRCGRYEESGAIGSGHSSE